MKAYWKRSAALVTDYAHKYRFDPFLRTEVHTIVLLTIFSLLILSIIGISSGFLYREVGSVISDAITESILAGAPPSSIGADVVAKMELLQNRYIVIISIIVIGVTVVAGYIVARVLLSPTRNALESQKQFIGNVAHELRTPLSNIKTSTEVALLETNLDKESRAIFKSTIDELDRISEIINNLLSLSASVRPERIEFHDIDLGAIIEHTMRKLHGLAESKQLEITTRMSERKSVWGNAAALEQIITNVVKNAIMFTPKGGHISVTLEPVYPDFMEFTVRDSGIGIPRKDLFRIFEPYYRAEQSRNRAKGGSGLGLAIVSELIKLHNGKITVQSIEKRGTTVMVLLPAGNQAPGIPLDSKKRKEEHVSEVAVDFSRNNIHKS